MKCKLSAVGIAMKYVHVYLMRCRIMEFSRFSSIHFNFAIGHNAVLNFLIIYKSYEMDIIIRSIFDCHKIFTLANLRRTFPQPHNTILIWVVLYNQNLRSLTKAENDIFKR